VTRPMMGFGLQNQEETHRREFESPPGYQQLGLDPQSPMAASRGDFAGSQLLAY